MGELFALLSATSFALSNIAVRIGLERSNEREAVFVTTLINVTSFTVIALIMGKAVIPASLSWISIGSFVVAGVLTAFVGRLLLYSAIDRIGPSRATSVRVTSPAFTVALAVLFLSEPFTLARFTGTTLVILGIWFVSRESMSVVMGGAGLSAPMAEPRYKLKSGSVSVGACRSSSFRQVWISEMFRGMDGILRRADTPNIQAGQAAQSEPERSSEFQPAAGLVKDEHSGLRQASLYEQAARSKLGLIYGTCSAASFGAGHFMRKVALTLAPSPLLGALIGSWSALAGIVLLNASSGELSAILRHSFKNFNWMYLGTGFFSTLGQLFSFMAIYLTTVSNASVISSTEPLLTMLFSAVMLRSYEVLSKRLVISGLCIVFGAVLISVF